MAQELYELPQGWEWNTLKGSCLKIKDGAHASPKSTDNGLPYVTVRDIDSNGFIDTQNCKKIRQEDFDKLIAGNCSPTEGSVLLSKDGTVGKVAVVNGYQQFVVLSSLAIITPKSETLSTYYLKYFLLSPRLQEYALKSKTGAAIKRIVLRNIAAFQIPVPPLAEQERIVAKLDALFSRIDQAIAQLQHTQAQTKALFASALDAAFNPYGNRKELPPRWCLVDLGKTCTFIRGPFGGSLKKAMFVPSGYAVYEQQHAIKDQFTSIRYFVNEEKFNEMKRFELHEGDLIMSCSGTMGKVAIAPSQVQRGIINQALLKLTMGESLLNTFLLNWMRSGGFTEALNELSSGAAIKNVASVKILKQIQIPLPPLAEQSKIVAQLDAISERTQALTTATSAQLEKLKALKASLLDAAFRGQLPSDQ